MPDVETAAETARNWVSWGQAAGLGDPRHADPLLPTLLLGVMVAVVLL